MAIFTASVAFNIGNIDFYHYNENFLNRFFHDNANRWPPYADSFELWALEAGVTQILEFAGNDLTFNPANNAVGGTVLALRESIVNGGPIWSATGISVSASAIANTYFTPSNADELALFSSGLAGNDTFQLSAGADVMNGYAGDDEMFGHGGNDRLNGNEGNDRLQGGDGADILDGFTGIDQARYDDATTGFTVAISNAAINTGPAAGDTFFSIEDLLLGPGNDTAHGSGAGNRIEGGGGADALHGIGGADRLLGGDGDDLLVGGGQGDQLDGGAGFDTASYEGTNIAVTANLGARLGVGGEAAGDTYVGVEALIGSTRADVLAGSGVANRLDGGAGDDVIYGDGADTIIGGAGNDVFFGGSGGAINLNLATAGIETVWGSVAGDIFNGAAATANLVMIGAGGADAMTGGAGADFLYFDELDTLAGGAGSDWAVATLSDSSVTLNMSAAGIESAWGSIQNDILNGAGAATVLVVIGDTGDDNIAGGSAADFLYGFGDNDRIKGGLGNDQLSGNAGSDVFVYDAAPAQWGVDTIWDFVRGADKINLAGSGFTNFGQLNITTSGGHSIVNGGNGGQIWVLNNATLGAGDFVFV